MTVSARYCLLFAQVDSLDGFVSALRNRKGSAPSGDMLNVLLWLAAVLVAVWVLARLAGRFSRRRGYVNSGRLLLSLCRAHKLRWSQWWLLRQVARAHKLEDPARLFLEPEWLDPSRLPPGMEARRSEILVLRARLFADLPEINKPPPAQVADVAQNGPATDKMPKRSSPVLLGGSGLADNPDPWPASSASTEGLGPSAVRAPGPPLSHQ